MLFHYSFNYFILSINECALETFVRYAQTSKWPFGHLLKNDHINHMVVAHKTDHYRITTISHTYFYSIKYLKRIVNRRIFLLNNFCYIIDTSDRSNTVYFLIVASAGFQEFDMVDDEL